MTRWEKWLSTIKGWFSPLWEGVFNLIIWALAGVLELVLDALEQAFRPLLASLTSNASSSISTADTKRHQDAANRGEPLDPGDTINKRLGGLLGEIDNPTSFGAAFLGQAAAAGATGGIISSTIGPWLLLLQYEIQRAANQYRFDPMTALAISVRRPDLADLVESDIRDQGMTKERFAALYDAALTRLKEDDYVIMRRRHGWTEETYLAAMKDLGYTPERAGDFYKSREFYPTPQDLIRWQAKEVFEENMVARYGLGAEFDDIDQEPFKRAGMTPDQILNFWLAHWEHASWTQVTDMLHRGILNSSKEMPAPPTTQALYRSRDLEGIEALDQYYRLVEVPPFWRRRMTEISFRPLTRVDVRRMHKVGTLSRKEVYLAYRAHGYHDANAELMTDFTLSYNETDERLLTKTDILGNLRKGIIAESAARDMLAVLGFDEANITILLTEPAPGAVENERTLTLSQLRQLYERNLRPWSQISPYLVEMGFQPDTITAVKTIWDWNKPTETKERTRDLTLAQLRQQYEKGLRGRSQITPFLTTMGYSAAEIIALFELWDWETPTEIKEHTRALTLTHVRQLYDLGLRQRTEVSAWLAAMGYSSTEAAALLEIWDWEKPPKVSRPSRADLDRFLSNAVIDFWTWYAEYAALGYSEQYTDWYFLDLVAREKVEG
jgi:hypothetical protein